MNVIAPQIAMARIMQHDNYAILAAQLCINPIRLNRYELPRRNICYVVIVSNEDSMNIGCIATSEALLMVGALYCIHFGQLFLP